MYKTAVVTLIALIILVVVGLMIATNKLDSVSDSKKDTEATEVIEEASTPTPTSTPSPTIESTEPANEPQADSETNDEVLQGTQVCKINPDCDLLTEYCYKANCGGVSGFCQTKPTSCPQTLSPVCSCNGKTYSSSCSAKESGANIAKFGTCSS